VVTVVQRLTSVRYHEDHVFFVFVSVCGPPAAVNPSLNMLVPGFLEPVIFGCGGLYCGLTIRCD
jgi:hypothetical protein